MTKVLIATNAANSSEHPRHGNQPCHSRAHLIGGWLPHDAILIGDYVDRLALQERLESVPIAPPIRALQNLLKTKPVVFMLFSQMLLEVPPYGPYNRDPSLQPQIRKLHTLILAINYQIQAPISYNESPLVGCPLNALLNWPMGTKAGFSAFLREDVNQVFREILQYWGRYLMSPDSLSTITEENNQWLSSKAQTDPQSPGLHNFAQTYICDPSLPRYGFQSWDDFFTRKFRPGLRPIASPHDDNIIVSAAESTPFALQHNVQLYDTFWTKGQRYSLTHLLDDPELAKYFEGGTVYQAFLSADSYHNWHAPIAGSYLFPPKIVPGTYYSSALMNGFYPNAEDGPPNPDDAAPNESQGYISCVATRGVSVIKARNEKLGLVAMVMVGMAEVSSVDFDVKEAGFEKGEEVGRFHFGGSTYCLIFRRGVEVRFVEGARMKMGEEESGLLKVGSALATVL